MTFVDLYNEDYRNGVSACALHLLHRIKGQQKAMPEDTEMVIMLEDYDDDGDGYGYGYYFASWEKRCVFWLEDIDYEFVTMDARVCVTESHIGTLLLPAFRPCRLLTRSLQGSTSSSCSGTVQSLL